MNEIVKILMKRDGLTRKEAEREVTNARKDLQKRLEKGISAFDICEEHFGLEPDYLDCLI